MKANEVQKFTELVWGTSVLEVRAHISTPVNILKDSLDPLELIKKGDSSYLLFKICFPTPHNLAVTSHRQFKQLLQRCQYQLFGKLRSTAFSLFHRVRKEPSTKELIIASIVLKTVARVSDGLAYFPRNPENEQNFAYLIVDSFNRQITTLVHHYGGKF